LASGVFWSRNRNPGSTFGEGSFFAGMDATLASLGNFCRQKHTSGLACIPGRLAPGKKHPFIQAIARSYRDFESLNVVQKTGYRYRQTECATQKIVDVIGRVASIVGLRYLWNTLLGWLNGTVAWIGKASRDAMRNNVEELSRVWLIGSIVRNYAARYSGDKPSERELRVFERWSIRFSAVYYEAKGREKETKGHTSA
jgi:hypothetical protein